MAQPDIPLSEFARRLCVTTHPGFGTTGSPAPCGTHTAAAQRYWMLLTDEGTKALEVILQVRREDGQHDVVAPDVDRLRTAISIVSIRHDWATTTDTEDRTAEIVAEYVGEAAARGSVVDERTEVMRRLITAASKIRGDEPGLAEAIAECERALGLRPERGGADG